jgi:hypothetical protein
MGSLDKSPNDLIEAIAKLNTNVERLARSSVKIERLTYALIGLTAVLVVLTIKLIAP